MECFRAGQAWLQPLPGAPYTPTHRATNSASSPQPPRGQSGQEINIQDTSETHMGLRSMSTTNLNKRPTQYLKFLDCKKEGRKPGQHEGGDGPCSSAQHPCFPASANLLFQREYTYSPRLGHRRHRGTRCACGRPVSSCWLPQRRPVGERGKGRSTAASPGLIPKGLC